MKKKSKFLTALLTIFMIISSIGSTVFAADPAHSDIDYGYDYLNDWDNKNDYESYLKKTKLPLSYNSYVNEASYAYGNEEYNNYKQRRFAHIITSYLTTYKHTLMTVQVAKNGKIGIEYYKKDGTFIRSCTIKQDLPIFGGFYDDGKYYYIVTGQENLNESNSKEVIRVTKYNKNWSKIKSCSLYGANTTKPFNAGCLRFAKDGKYLIIRTCHSMYALKGVNHQSNLTFEVDTDNMKITDSYYGMYSNQNGYVSHSFNQFVQIENHKLVAVDHGDAAPTRSMVIMNYNGTINDGTFNEKATYTNLMTFPGTYEINGNDTGATIGAFEISSKSYIIACTKDNNMYNPTASNIVIVAQNKSTKKITTNVIAKYSKKLASTPHLVSIGPDSYLLMWSLEGKVHYIKIDANGNKVGKEYSIKGNLSDCVPIVTDNYLYWYTRSYLGIRFYKINTSNLKGECYSTLPYKYKEWVKLKNDSNGQYLDTLVYVNENGIIDKNIVLTWQSNKKGKWVQYYNDKKLYSKDKSLGDDTYCIINRWIHIDDKWYFFDKNGYRAHNEWLNGYWFNKNGTWTYKYKGSWKHNSKGWWFGDTSGWYAKNEWYKIDGSWYYFGANGYMKTGWLSISGNKYYFNTDGRMQSGWKKIDKYWYYFGSNGIAVTATTKKIQGKSYTFDGSGRCKNP